jgi:hypothetical protein
MRHSLALQLCASVAITSGHVPLDMRHGMPQSSQHGADIFLNTIGTCDAQSSAFCATSLPFSAVRASSCFEAPLVRSPLGTGLLLRLDAPSPE